MRNILEGILSPITWLMGQLLELFHGVTASPGISVILLSVAMTLITWPLSRLGNRIESRFHARKTQVDVDVASLKAEAKNTNMSGEDRFWAQDQIYKKHGYHPIQSTMASASLWFLIPFFIAAYFLLSDHPILAGKTFGPVRDLTMPDGLLSGINLLPLLMAAVSIGDACLRFGKEPARRNYAIIATTVLTVLVYPLASSLALYWTSNNILSLVTNRLFAARKAHADET